MKAIMDALNVVYEEKEKRGFIKLNLVTLCFHTSRQSALLLARTGRLSLSCRLRLISGIA